MAQRQGFRSAEAWLRERGIRPEPITAPDPTGPDQTDQGSPVLPEHGPDVSRAESVQPGVPTHARADADGYDHPTGPAFDDPDRSDQHAAERSLPSTLEDDVVAAMSFLRRSANAAPQSEGRLREKLADRGCAEQVIERALSRARRERLVDDRALAAALVEERRARGHAPARIRRDLRDRGFEDAVLTDALGTAEAEDLDAVAFDVAIRKAESSTGVPADTAFRRVAAHLQRRGYPDGLARKVAREAVYSSREEERTAER